MTTLQQKLLNSYLTPENTPKENTMKTKAQQGSTGSNENLKRTTHHGKSADSMHKMSGSRRLLQTIQPSAKDGGLTREGRAGKQAKTPQGFKVYEDPKAAVTPPATPPLTSTPTRADRGVQYEAQPGGPCMCLCHEDGAEDKVEKTAEEEAYELMVQEEITEDYWKMLAEQRREALNETLEENQQLHDETERLKEENKSLCEMASQADYFASMLKKLTEPEEEESYEEEYDKSEEDETEEKEENVDSNPVAESQGNTEEADKDKSS